MNDRSPRTPNRVIGRSRSSGWLLLGLALIVGGSIWLVDYLQRSQSERAISEAEKQLAKAMNEANQLDGPWQIEDLQVKQESPEDTVDLLRAIQTKRPAKPPKKDRKVIPDQEELKANPVASWSFVENLPNSLAPPEGMKLLREEIDRMESTLSTVRTVAKQYRCRLPFEWSEDYISKLKESPQLGSISDMLYSDILGQAQMGSLDTALASWYAHLNIGRSFGHFPTPPAQRKRSSCHWNSVLALEWILGLSEPSTEVLQELQQTLTQEAEIPLFLIAARGERAAYDRYFQLLMEEKVSFPELGPAFTRDTDENPKVLLLRERAIFLSRMNEKVEIRKLPIHKQIQALPELRNRVDSDPPFVRRLFSSSELDIQFMPMCQALLRSSIPALAAERYRKKYQRWPTYLTDLVPEFLPSIPLDPYCGQPLRYQKFEDSIVVYSIGPDQIDRQGSIKRHAMGLYDNMGFQIWNPEHRRQTKTSR